MKKNNFLETIEIDHTLSLDEENELDLKRLEILLHQNRLYVDVKPDEKRFSNYSYQFNGRDYWSELYYDEKGETYLWADETNSKVELQIKFNGAMIPTDEEIQFEITQDDITDFKHQ
ncbi:hypothetical protein ACJROX_15755 [Pseudalkalibacillus sp. A8]|uniref:hypothetical protein n=1 Tax=Pseudalkalibacillus sp. A8 TaxID=3382641 RepID=UPI0038B51165